MVYQHIALTPIVIMVVAGICGVFVIGICCWLLIKVLYLLLYSVN